MSDDKTTKPDILDRLAPWSVHEPGETDGPNEVLVKDAMDEIQRLRTALEDIMGAQMLWHGGVGRPPYEQVVGHIDVMKDIAREALKHV